VNALLQSGEWAEAESANLEILAIAPDDVLALNRAGKIAEELGDTAGAIAYSQRVMEVASDPKPRSIATSRLDRLLHRTPSPPPPTRRPRLSRPSSSRGFTCAEAFLHVTAAIDRLYAQTHDWAMWFEIKEALMKDAAAISDISKWANILGKSETAVATNVMAQWCRSFTVTTRDSTDKYERRADGDAYRPRQQP
jgi:tetratricopeptide (TPR) repeat protein